MQLFAFRQTDFRFDFAAVKVHVQRHDRIARTFGFANEFVNFALVQQQLAWTDGVGLSKTLIIKDLKYIIQNKTAFISQSEYSQLITKEAFIVSKLNSYIKKYIKALEHQDIKKKLFIMFYVLLKIFS